jgi:L-amino acid N-acyltransferase YncA
MGPASPSMPGAGEPAVTVRPAAEADMLAVQAIYAEAVLHGLASFEEAPPTLDDMLARRAKVLGQGLPWLVAELDGRVAGYAYAASYRDRSGYRYTIEDSVYVAPDMQGRGVGRALLAALLERCNNDPWRQMVAVIGDSENKGSIALHESLGFRWRPWASSSAAGSIRCSCRSRWARAAIHCRNGTSAAAPPLSLHGRRI